MTVCDLPDLVSNKAVEVQIVY